MNIRKAKISNTTLIPINIVPVVLADTFGVLSASGSVSIKKNLNIRRSSFGAMLFVSVNYFWIIYCAD